MAHYHQKLGYSSKKLEFLLTAPSESFAESEDIKEEVLKITELVQEKDVRPR